MILNQVVYGFTFGLWLAFINKNKRFYFHFCLRDLIHLHIKTLSQNHSSQSFKENLFCAVLALIVVFMSQIVTYLIIDATFSPEPQWIAMTAQKYVYKKKNQTLANISAVQSGLSTAFFGAYLGILMQRSIFGLRYSSDPNMLKTVRDRAWWVKFLKFVARYLVMAVIGLPSILLFFLVPYSAHIAILIIFKTLIPIIYAAWAIYAFSFWAFEQLKLLDQFIMLLIIYYDSDFSRKVIKHQDESEDEIKYQNEPADLEGKVKAKSLEDKYTSKYSLNKIQESEDRQKGIELQSSYKQ